MIKIVECGSITEAARQLFVSQPSLSVAIKEIEAEYKIMLFYRISPDIDVTADGRKSLSYARQIVEQAELMEQRYFFQKPSTISTQHYAFAVSAFVNLISVLDSHEYECTLCETRTYEVIYEVIKDLMLFRSEIGIIYVGNNNINVLKKLFTENHLVFTPLFDTTPDVFINASRP